MITNMKILEIKGLKGCELLQLGKINVICGKNNSGKSTLLEGVFSQRVDGKEFTEIETEEFSNLILKAHSTSSIGSTQWYRSTIRDALKHKRVWYAEKSDQVNFLEVFVGLLRQRAINLPYNPMVFEKIYNSWFRKEESLSLIPSKRTLDLRVSVRTNQEINFSGDGILNYLFFAKNQVTNPDDKQVYEKIMRAFNVISSGYKFDISIDKDNWLTLRFSNEDHSWVNASDCGLGLQDLLVMLYFAIHPQFSVVLIEEPECHIHPDMQRRLLLFLREETTKQFFLTTHSNVFLDNTLVDKVFFTHFENSVMVDDATSRSIILNNLGYTVADNLVSDLIILVEGPTDKPVIEEFLVKFGLFGLYDIKIWPLGGDIMEYLDLSVFAQNYSIIALIDNDPGSKPRVRETFIENCQKYGISVFRLKRYALENYFPLRILKELYPDRISPTLTEIDPYTKLDRQLNTKETINYKRKNRLIAKQMSLDDIKDTDLYDFFGKVKEQCVKKSNHDLLY